MTEPEPSPPLFASFPRRLLALVVDGLVLLLPLAVAALLGAHFALGPKARAALFLSCLLFPFLYEPVLVAWTGRTLGHRVFNLKVVADTPTQLLSYPQAQLRWLLKVLTGIVGFVTMATTRRSQALHDLPFGTTVQIYDPARATSAQYLEERPATVGGSLPSPFRRIIVMLAYTVGIFIVYALATALTSSPECLETLRCSKDEELVSRLLGTGWLAVTLLVAILAWQGRIWGCRRRALPVPV